MKRFLLVLAALIAAAIAAAAVFVLTFDIDRYRPLLIQRAQQAIGRPIALDRLSLAWQGGLAVRLDGLILYEEQGSIREPLLSVRSVSALIALAPLLHKEVRVGFVLLQQPRIRLLRDPAGRLNLEGLFAAAAPAAAGGSRATLGETTLSFHVSSVRIEEAEVRWSDASVTPPLERTLRSLRGTLRSIAPGRPMEIELEGALASEKPNIRLKGRLTFPDAEQEGSFDSVRLEVERLPLESVLPPSPAGKPQLRGLLSTQIEGRAASLNPSQALRSLSGIGSLDLDEPLMANLNILRVVFEKFSMIPGLVEKLRSRLPPEYQAKFDAKDTVLLPIHLPFRMESGRLQLESFDVRADTFALSGRGTLSAEGVLSAQAQLRVDPVFSEALIRSVSELRSLTNADGEMEIPVLLQSQPPYVLPDLRYLSSKIIATTAVNLIGELLKQKEEAKEGVTTPDSTDRSGTDLLGQFLQKALEPRAPSNSSSP